MTLLLPLGIKWLTPCQISKMDHFHENSLRTSTNYFRHTWWYFGHWSFAPSSLPLSGLQKANSFQIWHLMFWAISLTIAQHISQNQINFFNYQRQIQESLHMYKGDLSDSSQQFKWIHGFSFDNSIRKHIWKMMQS